MSVYVEIYCGFLCSRCSLSVWGCVRVLCHLNGLVSRLSEAITNANTECCTDRHHIIGCTCMRCCALCSLCLSVACFADGTDEPLRLIFYDCRTAHTHTHTMELSCVAGITIIRWQQRAGQTNNKTTQPTNWLHISFIIKFIFASLGNYLSIQMNNAHRLNFRKRSDGNVQSTVLCCSSNNIWIFPTIFLPFRFSTRRTKIGVTELWMREWILYSKLSC